MARDREMADDLRKTQRKESRTHTPRKQPRRTYIMLIDTGGKRTLGERAVNQRRHPRAHFEVRALCIATRPKWGELVEHAGGHGHIFGKYGELEEQLLNLRLVLAGIRIERSRDEAILDGDEQVAVLAFAQDLSIVGREERDEVIVDDATMLLLKDTCGYENV